MAKKGRIPAILREVFEKPFTPFPHHRCLQETRDCTTLPDAISVELVKKSPPVGREADEANHQGEGTVIAGLTLDGISNTGGGSAEVLTEMHVMSALHV